jgi:hypothetical protein
MPQRTNTARGQRMRRANGTRVYEGEYLSRGMEFLDTMLYLAGEP